LLLSKPLLLSGSLSSDGILEFFRFLHFLLFSEGALSRIRTL
jgi:hypothetical protein